jgi:hypothetical protein
MEDDCGAKDPIPEKPPQPAILDCPRVGLVWPAKINK